MSRTERESHEHGYIIKDITKGTHLTGPIYKPVLIKHIHRFGLPQAACPLHLDTASIHFPTGLLNHGHAVAEIAAQRDISGA